MPIFVHFAPETAAGHICKVGLRAERLPALVQAGRFGIRRGVFALPVLPNFQVSHQWLRELRRRGPQSLVAVYFRIPDEEPVLIGRYNREHAMMTAAEAVANLLRSEDPFGVEVAILRSIPASAITRVRRLRQLTGWRHYPGSHGRPPFCNCPYCQRGNIKAQRLRRLYPS